jgi:aspartate racemase
MHTLGILAHSAEGAALCFITACRHGAALLGEHDHPPIVLSAIPMARSMPAWRSGNHAEVAAHLLRGVHQLAAAGADFYICPDNTAHIVLEHHAAETPIPGLHIARVVCDEIARLGHTRVGLLGTHWTMTGPVYEHALAARNMHRLIPDGPTRLALDAAIFDELCNGVFRPQTVHRYVEAIDDLKRRGAQCVILGCTEIPLIITNENSPLPTIDSTRLLARCAVERATNPTPITSTHGWL